MGEVHQLDSIDNSEIPLEEAVQFEYTVTYKGVQVDNSIVRAHADVTLEEQLEVLNAVAEQLAKMLAHAQQEWAKATEAEGSDPELAAVIAAIAAGAHAEEQDER